MKTCKDWLEQLMAARSVTAYGAAKLIGIDTNTAYNYKAGTRAFDAFTATRVAELLNVDPVLVIASAEAERAKDAERRAYWERLGGTAAAVLVVWLVTGVFVADPDIALAFAPALFGFGPADVYYVKSVIAIAIPSFHAFVTFFFMLFLAFELRRQHTARP